MSLLEKIKSLFSGHIETPKLSEWFVVTYDDEQIHLQVDPPGRSAWEQSIRWQDITRVCFKAEGLYLSDGIYLFTDRRPESYVIPVEANGGAELWQEILRRGLFDPELAVKAMSAEEGLFCWPDIESS